MKLDGRLYLRTYTTEEFTPQPIKKDGSGHEVIVGRTEIVLTPTSQDSTKKKIQIPRPTPPPGATPKEIAAKYSGYDTKRRCIANKRLQNSINSLLKAGLQRICRLRPQIDACPSQELTQFNPPLCTALVRDKGRAALPQHLKPNTHTGFVVQKFTAKR